VQLLLGDRAYGMLAGPNAGLVSERSVLRVLGAVSMRTGSPAAPKGRRLDPQRPVSGVSYRHLGVVRVAREFKVDSREARLRKRIAFISIIIAASLFGPVAIVEGGARAYIHFKYGVPGKSYGLWRRDAAVGAQHNENAYNTRAETNDFGFRNSEDVINPKLEGSYRIIAYGGSTTFCYNLSNEESWPLQLQAVLRRQHNAGDQVLNGGAIMWSLGHAFARAKKDLPVLKPDYVLIYSGINEYVNAQYLKLDGVDLAQLVEQGQYGAFATNFDQNRWIKRNLILIRVLDYIIAPWLQKEGGNAESLEIHIERYVLENYLGVLRKFIALIKAQGGAPIFVIQTHSQARSNNSVLTSVSRRGATLARELGATIVDAEELIHIYTGDPRDLFASSGVHYSKEGAQLLAQLIFKRAFVQDALVSEKG